MASPSSETGAPEPPETIEVEDTTVACDGGGGALGHPRVFLTLKGGRAECGYCDRLFVLKEGVKPASGH
ncbi:MAG: zinc-finger domain-containing protein [Rhodospirillaceae bacterium]|jgi:uncharacterized Zn-finger protein|nr:zinc-finger domain-containing protein [Rhodospirillaceae bacterium]MBT5458781.1 zinc-finger domain-containing protein [Rhodospirillaceae bacterium]MBT7756025.1 zinc-finger domain-containing protein [Rhodospirillaceae bacterium]